MKDDDFKLLMGFADGRTNEQTYVIVESLSRLKIKLHFLHGYLHMLTLYGFEEHLSLLLDMYTMSMEISFPH